MIDTVIQIVLILGLLSLVQGYLIALRLRPARPPTEPRCLGCDYSLLGLDPEKRCPECGIPAATGFDRALLAEKRQLSCRKALMWTALMSFAGSATVLVLFLKSRDAVMLVSILVVAITDFIALICVLGLTYGFLPRDAKWLGVPPFLGLLGGTTVLTYALRSLPRPAPPAIAAILSPCPLLAMMGFCLFCAAVFVRISRHRAHELD